MNPKEKLLWRKLALNPRRITAWHFSPGEKEKSLLRFWNNQRWDHAKGRATTCMRDNGKSYPGGRGFR